MNTLKKGNSKSNTTKWILMAIAVFAIFAFMSCAPGANELIDTPNEEGDTAGFWQGLWHGFIAFFTFVISIFNDKVNVYEIHNSGVLYNLGFILGVSIFFGGSGTAGGRKSRDDY